MRESFTKFDFFRVKYFLATSLIFFFIWVLSILPFTLALNDPVSNALIDFDSYDVVFSKLRNQPVPDTSIVIVNIGLLDRAGIAKQIERIENENPKVIGIDILLENNNGTFADSFLTSTIKRFPNIVLVTKLEGYNSTTAEYDSSDTSDLLFGDKTKYGFANLPSAGDEIRRTVRTFIPEMKLKNTSMPSFAAAVAALYKREALTKLKERNNVVEPINFRRNISEFGYYFYNYDQVLDSTVDLSICKDKIVLLGFTGLDLQTQILEDIFFTPLNKNYAGKSFPDMYGVVIHANIISMILSGDYIDEMPFLLSLLIAFILCYNTVYSLDSIERKLPQWTGAIAKIIIGVEVIFYFSIAVFVFYTFNLKMNLTVTLVAIFIVHATYEFYHIYILKIYHQVNTWLKNKRSA